MAIEDIERLKEKVEKDPNSKLFVPLAEEYKKAGMIDEAIDVLIRGLERQPDYLSARVSLGKIYIEKGMLNEAKGEFEKVTLTIPDNLFAHKKLAEIYRDLGDRERAGKAFRTVLKLNPMDEWAETGLSELEGPPAIHAYEPHAETAESMEISAEETPFEIPVSMNDLEATEHVPGGIPGVPPEAEQVAEHAEEEFPEIPVSEKDAGILPDTPDSLVETGEERESHPASALSEEDRNLWKAHMEAVEHIEEGAEPFEIPLPEKEIESWEEAPPAMAEEATETATEISPEAEEVSEIESLSFEDILNEPGVVEEEKDTTPMQTEDETPALLEKADRHILGGNYAEALNIYKNLLSSEPDNPQIMQRVEELKTLLKLLGRDKEALVARLDSFLNSIKKRRDEFLGSS